MMRKNQSTPTEYLKLVRLTEYGEENKSDKVALSENSHYRSYDVEDLVEKIKQQQGQIQKLLGIIDKYKSKIEEFQQYEEVIKEFLARKQQQKCMPQNKNHQKLFDMSTIIQNSKISTEPLKKINKQLIVPSYSITIFCENQRFQYEKVPSIRFGTPNKTATFSIDSKGSNVQTQQEKDYKSYKTNYKDKTTRDLYYKGCRSLTKSNSTFDISNSIPYLNESEYLQEVNRMSMIHRVPSVNNMKRIQKCFKLLKS